VTQMRMMATCFQVEKCSMADSLRSDQIRQRRSHRIMHSL
jgi:hypothetical protein